MSRRSRRNHTSISLFAFQDVITCVMGIMLLLTLLLCLQISATSVSQFTSRGTVKDMQEQAASLNNEVERLSKQVDMQNALLGAGAIENIDLLKDRSQQLANDVARAARQASIANIKSGEAANRLASIQEVSRQRRTVDEATDKLADEAAAMKVKLQQIKDGRRIIYNGHNSDSKSCWLIELQSGRILAAELGHKMRPLTFQSPAEFKQWAYRKRDSSFLFLVKPSSADLFEQLTGELRKSGIPFGFDLLPENKSAIDPLTGAQA